MTSSFNIPENIADKNGQSEEIVDTVTSEQREDELKLRAKQSEQSRGGMHAKRVSNPYYEP